MAQLYVGPLSPVVHLVQEAAPVVTEEATVGDAARAMRSANVSAVLVGHAGLVTERDLAGALAIGLGPDAPVASIAVREPVVVAPDTPVVDAAHVMLHAGVRHLVLDPRGVPGAPAIVSVRRVLAVLLESTDPALAAITLHLATHDHAEIWLG